MPRENIYTGVIANDGSGDTLRLAMTKVNNNFVELYTQVTNVNANLNAKIANTWTDPQTSNTYSMIQVSGVNKVALPAANTSTLNKTSTRNGSGSLLYISRDNPTDNVLMPIFNGNVPYPRIFITIGQNSSEGLISTYSNTEWVLAYNNGPVSYLQGENITVNISYIREAQPWFDPQALGYNNFRGAKIAYRAYIDGIEGYNEIGEIFYSSSDDNTNYETNYTRVKSKSATQTANLNIRKSTNKLHYENTSVTPGNLHIQWTGTVWTGQDR